MQAAHQARRVLSPAFMSANLVMLSLLPVDDGATKFARAIIAGLERSRPYFSTSLGDLPLTGFAALGRFFAGHARQDIGEFIVLRAWTMLPPADQPRTLDIWAR
jgi:hypothetical protein